VKVFTSSNTFANFATFAETSTDVDFRLLVVAIRTIQAVSSKYLEEHRCDFVEMIKARLVNWATILEDSALRDLDSEHLQIIVTSPFEMASKAILRQQLLRFLAEMNIRLVKSPFFEQ
jgi:hypothetical protein